MGFMDDLKKQLSELGGKKVQLEIISGANQIFPFNKKKAIMSETSTPGIVSFGRNLDFYFLGVDRDRSSSRNMGKAAAGTIIGSVLMPGVGTVIGAAVGAKKKDDSIAELELVNTETKQTVLLSIKCDAKKQKELGAIKISNYQQESEESTPAVSGADELLKYKGLLDSGVINQEEFDTKKKELLKL